ARVNSEQEHFLIVPFGLLYSEVTASSLVKINIQGDVVDRGSTNLGVNQAGFTLHSAIYAARPDVKCIVHIHTPAGAAVSMPFSLLSLVEGNKEKKIKIKTTECSERLQLILGFGVFFFPESFHIVMNVTFVSNPKVVRTLASAGGPDNLVLLDPGKYKAKSRSPESPAGEGTVSHPKWQIGEQEFEALMRMLDNLGYRTGYPYRCPALREKSKKYSDVEIPASVTGYSFTSDGESGTCSPLRHSFQKQQREKTRWLNSGRGDDASEEGQNGSSPKSKTKWTKEDGHRTATSAVPNLFVPLNTNPKEVQEMRNKIREQNLQDIKTAGPQSQVLAGVVVDRSLVQGELVTASKAIIEKEYQPKVIVSTTGPNPFNKLTDRELEEYRKEVERKQKGPEEPSEDGRQQKERSPPDPTSARTPPSTPIKIEEETQQDQTYRDDSDAATFKQTLPDLTPDEPSEALSFPPLGKEEGRCDEDVPKSQTESPAVENQEPQSQPAEEPVTPTAEEGTAADAGSDESPGKSPSKKKKKFRTPSFLKKSKKKSDS
ncbi:ADDA protein, partial [Corythaeola cristata]|nr:ADDA protein [Corythaeola cristata]